MRSHNLQQGIWVARYSGVLLYRGEKELQGQVGNRTDGAQSMEFYLAPELALVSEK